MIALLLAAWASAAAGSILHTSPLTDLYVALQKSDSLLETSKREASSAAAKLREFQRLQDAADLHLEQSKKARASAHAAYDNAIIAYEKTEVGKCAKRVREHCKLPLEDYHQMDLNVETCKHVESLHREIFQLRETGKVVVVDTAGRNANIECPRTVYTLDTTGIKTMKVIGPTPFFLANSGRVYAMLAEAEIYEIRSGKGNSYHADDIKGGDGKIILALNKSHGGGDVEWSLEKLNKFVESGSKQVVQVTFKRTTTYKSLFRDEL